MKTLILLLLSTTSFAQETPKPFFSLGNVIQVGAFYKNVEFNAQFKPHVVSTSVGYKLLDWVTPSIGIGYYYRTDFDAYDKDPTGATGFTKVDGLAPIISLEVRHTWWFVGISHCDQTFFTAGLKFHRKWN